MMELSKYEMLEVNGGGWKAVAGGILLGFAFVASVIYGFINPNRCNR